MLSPVMCETIGNLDDGTAKAAINRAILDAVRDVDDRGSDKKVRKVVITLEFVKISDRDVAVTCEVGTTTPKYRTGDTIARLNAVNGRSELLFQDMAPEDPRQETIDKYTNKNEE